MQAASHAGGGHHIAGVDEVPADLTTGQAAVGDTDESGQKLLLQLPPSEQVCHSTTSAHTYDC